VTSLLKIFTVPDVGLISPQIIEVRVVFPAALGPSKPKNSPSLTVRLMLLRASTSEPLYLFLRLHVVITGFKFLKILTKIAIIH
jgi:hypothetical protein